ncbi:MAG: GT4 family glycosyltransferase PelF [Dehalococcoidales bacterium]|jgi:glycosyltransferase involved in cell wall biosynthesis|nr:GT4 family glycosyltransferase PelF [Dehalococcoidales bacterium]
MQVCLISEGSYPVIAGGLSEWAHMLIKALKDIEFKIFCIIPYEEEKPWKYERLPNISSVVIKPIVRTNVNKSNDLPRRSFPLLLNDFLNLSGEPHRWNIASLLSAIGKRPTSRKIFNSKEYWDFMVNNYSMDCPGYRFSDYFWGIYGVHQIMLDSLNFVAEIPEADLYHCLSVGFSGLAGAIAKELYNRPVVLTEQGLYLVERRKELSRAKVPAWYEKQLMNLSENLVKTSYYYADKIVPPCYSHIAIEKQLGADPAKIVVINNGIEAERFLPAEKKSGEVPIVGCFARVVPIKGITTLIQAARIVCEKHRAKFLVLGDIMDKQYYSQCEELIQNLGLQDHFHFMGHVDPVEWYHKVDIFTLSSISEGVPYALLEAMSCGLPAVCTGVGGIPEIISSDTGFVVPPEQPEILADRLCLLVENKDLRIAMGKRATQLVQEKYTIRMMADNFRNLYKSLLQ